MSREAMKLALEALEGALSDDKPYIEKSKQAVTALREALAEQPAQQEPVTVLPDGSAFAVMSYPLPKDHWLYADRQYNDGEYEPVELGKPVLTHELRDAVVSAVRYAIRGATNCGKEVDFDPDALVQNAVYALCGPFTSPPAQRKPLTDEQKLMCWARATHDADVERKSEHQCLMDYGSEIEAAHGITKGTK